MNIVKNINLFQGIGVVITTLLGSGIFIVPAVSASLTDGNSLYGWFILSILIVPISYIFGLLGNRYPHIAGSSYFVKKSFGDKLARVIGYLYISIVPIGPPVVVITGATYLSSILNQDISIIAALVMICIISILNQFKYSISSNIGLVIVILIVSIIIFMSYFAYFEQETIKFNKIDKSFFNSLGVMFWCFVGIEAISHLSSEFKYKNDFLKVIIFGTLIVGLLYSLVSYSVLKFNIYGDELVNFKSLIIIFDTILPLYGKYIISIVGFFICLIAVNLYVASTTRLLYSYTKEKISFNKNLLIIIATITITVILKLQFNIKIESLILYANGVFAIIYLFVAISGIKLLKGKERFISIVAALILLGTIITIGINILYAAAIFILLYFTS